MRAKDVLGVNATSHNVRALKEMQHQPFLQRWKYAPSNLTLFRTPLAPIPTWVVATHRLMGSPLLAGTFLRTALPSRASVAALGAP